MISGAPLARTPTTLGHPGPNILADLDDFLSISDLAFGFCDGCNKLPLLTLKPGGLSPEAAFPELVDAPKRLDGGLGLRIFRSGPLGPATQTILFRREHTRCHSLLTAVLAACKFFFG